jgi:potassium efflux system protein
MIRRFGYALCPIGRAIAVILMAAGVTLASAQQSNAPTPPQPTTQPAAEVPAAPSSPSSPTAAGLDDIIKTTLDEIEKTFTSDATAEDALTDLKRRVAAVGDELRSRQAQLDPRLKQIEQRIALLGTPPRSPATEDAAITAERTRLRTQRNDVDDALKQIMVLAGRAADLEQRIDNRRRDLFTGRLFARAAGPFDTEFWNALAEAVPAEFTGLAGLGSQWLDYARSNGGIGGALAATAALGVLAVLAWFAVRFTRRLIDRPTPRRFDKALVAVVLLIANAGIIPALILGTVLVLSNFGLMPPPVTDIGFGLAAAAAAAGYGRGLGVALFALGTPQRRLFAFPDHEADSYAAYFIWMGRALGAVVFLTGVHRAVGAPVAPMIATSELMALGVLAAGDGIERRLGWLRGILWLIVIAIGAALATGYVGLAVFIAGRMLAILATGGTVAILVVFIDALITEFLAPDAPQGRRLAAMFGLTPRGLELSETLLSAVLRVVLIVIAVMLGVDFAGLFAEDLFGVFQRFSWDYMIGSASLSPSTILSAATLVVVGSVVIRAAQRWLETKFLPRTNLDAGLQNSIIALFGYAGLIAVLALALGTLGIDLQKIAIIAGALSVGIGFGLQSVVSNFVSGLILLAERPIRVGDWVVVKNEEGWVRRISVRATEIETFDRATVIVPNQEFITGIVRNWTHGDAVGRIVIKVRVTYDADVAKIREILLDVANAHPQVVHSSPPAAYLIGFGDIGIDFELRCFIGNVVQAYAVRTDLQTEILRRFHDAAVKIPLPGHDERVPGAPDSAARTA